MKVGFAEAEFTPEEGNMPGGFLPNPAKGTVGGLFANAAAFENETGPIILLSLDILSFKAAFAADVRARISEKTGVAPDHILMVAIHTHTSAALNYQLWLCPPCEEDSVRTADAAVAAGVAAWENRREATLLSGVTEERRFSFNRDYYTNDGKVKMNCSDAARICGRAGSVDYSLHAMKVLDKEGRVLGFLVNYANHPDCYGGSPRTFYSADYPGFLRRGLKARYGAGTGVLFFNGTAGDINCIDKLDHNSDWFYGKGQAPEVIGTGLAEDIEALDKAGHFYPVPETLAVRSTVCRVPRRFRSEEDLEWAREVAKDMSNRKPMEQAFATEYLEPVDTSLPEVELEVQTVRLGDWTAVGLPSEIYTEIGQRIKNASPFGKTLIFELANGTNGYICPDRIINSTTYEARVSKYNSYTGLGTADILVKTALSELHAHKKEESAQ